MKTDSIMKSILKAVKSKEELKAVTCVYSKSRDFASNPVCSFTLCVGIGKAEYYYNPDDSGSQFTTEVSLCLLAPSGAGGKRLSEMSLWIAEAIKDQLSVRSIKVSEPKYNDTSSTLFADISVTVEDVSLADIPCRMYVDGEYLEGLVSFESESKEVYEEKQELLNGGTYKTGDIYYLLKLKTQRPLKPYDGFELRFESDGYEEVYSSCSVNKAQRELSKYGDMSFCYDITAKGLILSGNEVQDEQ